MLIYVAGKYTAPTPEGQQKNVDDAREVAKEVLLLGHTPVIPHACTKFFDYDKRFEEWRHAEWLDRYCYPLLSRCDAVVFCPGWTDSLGARAELVYAEENQIPIFFEVEELGRI